jgi:hypothetical protein
MCPLLAAIDACVTSACSQSGEAATTCSDKPAPAGADASGRDCTCPAGYAYTEAAGCKSESLESMRVTFLCAAI